MSNNSPELSDAAFPGDPRLAGATLTPMAAGQSGATVYLVSGPAGQYVLKQTAAHEPLEAWERAVAMQRAAATAGVAPAVLNTNADRRAVLSEHVPDQKFAPRYAHPDTHAAAMQLLADTLRRVHAIPLAESAPMADALGFLRQMYGGATASGPLPAWADEQIVAQLAAAVPASDRAVVVSHNDVNPSNLLFDGTRLVLADWQSATANDPYYDLATVSVFLRMDQAACLRLLTAYAGTAVTALPARFVWSRAMAATLAGAAFLFLACQRGHVADIMRDAHEELTLSEVYAALREGRLDMRSAGGQWQFGLALLREVR